MLSFLKFLKKKEGPVRIAKPITGLYHGSKEQRSVINLPKKYLAARAADGHAVYMTNHLGEAESYGNHIHRLSFHVDKKTELLNMDKPLNKQHKAIKAKIAQLNVPTTREEWPHNAHITHLKDVDYTGSDWVRDLGQHIGHEEVPGLLHKHGIHGGYGESVPPDSSRRSRQYSTVYSSYAPHKHVEITGHQLKT